MNSLRTIGGETGQIAVAYAEPPVSPPVNRPIGSVATPSAVHVASPVAPAPAAASATPSPQPAAPAAAPAPAPTAAPEQQAPLEPAAADQSIAVFLHLSSGERIWAGRFGSPDLAEQRAKEIVAGLIRPEPGVWAKFGNRLIRPTAVVSIELAPRRED